jgi:hypothetical protein
MSDTESEITFKQREKPVKGRSSTFQSETMAQQQTTVGSLPFTHSHISNQTTIPEAYHLVGIENYGSWAFRMKNILMRDSLYDYCISPPSEIVSDQERRGRQAAMSAINSSVKGGVALKLLKRYSEPFDCWTSLKSCYESDSTARQMSLIDKFFTIRKTGRMDEYLADIKEAADQMEEVDVGLPAKVVNYHTLKNLPSEFDMIKQVILNERKPSTYLELESRLLTEEMTRKNVSQERDNEALALTYRPGSRRPYTRGPLNQGGRYGNTQSNSQRGTQNSSTVYHGSHAGNAYSGNNSSTGSYSNHSTAGGYSNHGNSGHHGGDRYNKFKPNYDNRSKSESLEQELRALINRIKDIDIKLQREEKRKRNLGTASQVHNLESDQGDDDQQDCEVIGDEGIPEDDSYASQVVDAYLAEVNNVDTTPSSTSWYLDSGASNHVSGNSSVFSSFSQSSGTKITSAGGHTHDVTGMGSIAIRLPSGEIQKISHILYSPGIKKNLLSVGFLTDKGFRLKFLRDVCIIKNPEGHKIAVAVRDPRNGLYKLSGETLEGCSEVSQPEVNFARCNAQQVSTAALWHRRLGHYHYQGIRRMINAGAVTGIPSIAVSNIPCHSCI